MGAAVLCSSAGLQVLARQWPAAAVHASPRGTCTVHVAGSGTRELQGEHAELLDESVLLDLDDDPW